MQQHNFFTKLIMVGACVKTLFMLAAFQRVLLVRRPELFSLSSHAKSISHNSFLSFPRNCRVTCFIFRSTFYHFSYTEENTTLCSSKRQKTRPFVIQVFKQIRFSLLLSLTLSQLEKAKPE